MIHAEGAASRKAWQGLIRTSNDMQWMLFMATPLEQLPYW